MLRSLAFGAVVLALVSAYALYSINMRTRVIAREVKAKEARKQKLIESIAVLKAERAFRARPEVIGPLAEKLGNAASRRAPVHRARATAARRGKPLGGAGWPEQFH